MKRQFMHMQPSQGKETPGYAQSNASPQPETTPPYPKKNGSGLLSGYNAAVNNGQRPQASSKPTPPGSIGQPPRSAQVPRKEVGKQHPSPTGPLLRGANSSFASRVEAPASQRPAQQPPNLFAPSNAPLRPAQQPYQAMPSQTRPVPNFDKQKGYAETPPTARVANNPGNPSFPVSPPPAMPKTYPNTGNLALRGTPGEASPPRDRKSVV